ncbi:PASTA domain-containing protein [uncultured Flavobacterium sp.]|uniref:PASTA domain-containing protein n=1 Tax=uncultured Flavobacterium sp. TaxID=165435 RepID=UPI0025E29F66|nr:PASTA domain-containing protein [uncultured Flavobacterium sp.]
MTLKEYLTSKTFFKQLLIALVIVIVLVFLLLQYLSFATDHGNEITVPDLRKLTEEQAGEKLDELDLEYVLLDTIDYNKDFPKYSVVQQDPLPGAKVKEGRKIYIKVNSAGFGSVTIPDLIEKTLRQAEPTLKAIGLEIGKKTYKPYLGKDMVLEMYSNGKKLKPGDKVKKSSVIDLVLGDGKVGFEEEVDSTTNESGTETETEKAE